MTVSDAALKAVAANSVRHLLEADQHYKARRYPSATASAVLSIEEAGKLSFITAHESVPKEKRHVAHAMLFVALGHFNFFALKDFLAHGSLAAPRSGPRTDLKHMLGTIPVTGELEGHKRVPYALLNGSGRLLLRAANGENPLRGNSGSGGRI